MQWSAVLNPIASIGGCSSVRIGLYQSRTVALKNRISSSSTPLSILILIRKRASDRRVLQRFVGHLEEVVKTLRRGGEEPVPSSLELRKARYELITKGFEVLEKNAQRALANRLLGGYRLRLTRSKYEAWPQLCVQVVHPNRNVVDDAYVIIRGDDSTGKALVEVLTPESEDAFSLLDENGLFEAKSCSNEHMFALTLMAEDLGSASTTGSTTGLQVAEQQEVLPIEIDGNFLDDARKAQRLTELLGCLVGDEGVDTSPFTTEIDFERKEGESGADASMIVTASLRLKQPSSSPIDSDTSVTPQVERSDEFSEAIDRASARSSGTLVNDRYELQRLLGTGVSGAVFRARDICTDRQIAIKMLHPTLMEDDDLVDRFFREVLVLQRVRHPNVIEVFDFGYHRTVIYFTMEHIDGLSLSAFRKKRKLPFDAIRNISLQLSQGLSAIHAKNILHRDLKSENILITNQGEVKIVDFGLARCDEVRKTSCNAIYGTPSFMAPEIWRGLDPSPKSDLYSLGVTLYELLVGTMPFTGGAIVSVVQQHMNEDPVLPEEVLERTPHWYSSMLMQLLEKTPEKRPTLKQVVQQLKKPNQ